MQKKDVFVVNLKGEREPFSFQKVYQSARNVGASKEVALKIAKEIEKEVFDGMLTSQIFERVFEILLKESPHSAIKFNLKKAIAKLGPTGFPFEKFVAKIFEREGFEVKINQIVPGVCVNYEVDFLAKKDHLLYFGECKFKKEGEGKVDLKDALVNYGRFCDLKKRRFFNSNLIYKSIIVTNAKFTIEAIKYSECFGVELLGWKYPLSRGLEYLIEKNKLYPITILPSVNHYVAKELIFQNIVLVSDVLKNNVDKIKIPLIDIDRIKKEAQLLI